LAASATPHRPPPLAQPQDRRAPRGRGARQPRPAQPGRGRRPCGGPPRPLAGVSVWRRLPPGVGGYAHSVVEWTHDLASAYAACRGAHPEDRALVVCDLDGTRLERAGPGPAQASRGVVDVVRWFHAQPLTSVAVVVDRPEAERGPRWRRSRRSDARTGWPGIRTWSVCAPTARRPTRPPTAVTRCGAGARSGTASSPSSTATARCSNACAGPAP